jgi:hypothetical protein
MSESRLEELLQEMPPKERRLCESDILQMGTQLKDEELLICARSGFPFGTLAVTLTRLIVFLQDGGVEVTPYSDVASFSLIEGKKKILGGYSHTFLNTRMRNGGNFSGQILGVDGPWAIRTGKAILAAHQDFTLNEQ